MLIRTFRKSYLLQYILLVILHILLWGGAFISPGAAIIPEHPVMNPAYSLMTSLIGNNSYVSIFIAFFLVLTGSMIFNYTLEKNNLAGHNSLLPALTFIIIMGLFPPLQVFHPALIAGVIMIIVLDFIFDIYSTEDDYSKVFNSGFLIAIGSFFYFPTIGFMLLIWLIFILYRLYNWREWVILFLGFITPYILLWTYYFWNDQLIQVFQTYSQYFTPKAIFEFQANITVLNYIIIAFILVLFLRALVSQAIHIQENVISVRKRFWAVVLFLILSVLSFLFSGKLALFHLVFIQISLALIIQGWLFRIKKILIPEILLGILIMLILINNYYIAFISTLNAT